MTFRSQLARIFPRALIAGAALSFGLAAPTYSSPVDWAPPDFISSPGASASAAGNTLTILLPNFSVASVPDSIIGTILHLDVHAFSTGPEEFLGLRYTYFGEFSGYTNLGYLQESEFLTFDGTSFRGYHSQILVPADVPANVSLTGFLPSPAYVGLPGVYSASTEIDLVVAGKDGIESFASIDRIELELVTADIPIPEPGTLSLVGLGVAVLARRRLKRGQARLPG